MPRLGLSVARHMVVEANPHTGARGERSSGQARGWRSAGDVRNAGDVHRIPRPTSCPGSTRASRTTSASRRTRTPALVANDPRVEPED